MGDSAPFPPHASKMSASDREPSTLEALIGRRRLYLQHLSASELRLESFVVQQLHRADVRLSDRRHDASASLNSDPFFSLRLFDPMEH